MTAVYFIGLSLNLIFSLLLCSDATTRGHNSVLSCARPVNAEGCQLRESETNILLHQIHLL